MKDGLLGCILLLSDNKTGVWSAGFAIRGCVFEQYCVLLGLTGENVPFAVSVDC